MADSKKKNLIAPDAKKNKKVGRKRSEPARDTSNYPLLLGFGGQYVANQRMRPSTLNLRYFSKTPYVRRAINALKNPITLHKWEIKPVDGVKSNAEIEKQIEIASQCFAHPNHDDSFSTLIGLIIEDWCTMGSGCIEHQIGSDPIRPIWMWPVDSQSVYVYPAWSGGRNEARYFQALGFNDVGLLINEGIKLRNDELIYMRANPNNGTPYGLGPVQVAFESIARILGTGEYAGNLATNAQPENLLFFKGMGEANLRALRAYWRNEIEGQGQTPIFGGKAEEEPINVKLHSGNDDALYLKYQEFLKSEIAVAFDLSPQNLGVERDVNRNTSEVAEDRDWNQAIMPLAATIQEYLTREVLHSKLGWYSIQFAFKGIERDDEVSNSQIFKTNYECNMITPNEERARKGMEPMKNAWGDMTKADVDIAVAAARGSKIVDDPDLANSEVQKGSPGGGS